MRPHSLPRTPTQLVALIAAITLVPLVTLLWLGWRLIEQDHALERQQVQQRVERAADLLVASLERAIAAAEQQLAAGEEHWPDGGVAVTVRGDDVTVHPRGRVAYIPKATALLEAPEAIFARAEILEFRDRNSEKAAAVLAELATSLEPAVRAGAELRRARNLRKLGRIDDALTTYARLATADQVAVGGVPVSLAAAYARCTLLAEQHRRDLLTTEAAALDRQLRAGRWPLTGAVYALYTRDAATWSGRNPNTFDRTEIMAQAVDAISTGPPASLPSARARREALVIGDEPFAIVWQPGREDMRALVAAPEFVTSQWLKELATVASHHQVSFAIRAVQGANLFGSLNSSAGATATRPALATGLPWDILASTIAPPPEAAAFSARRRWLIAGLLVLVVMGLLAGYVVVRGVSRELAVARLQSDFVAAVSHEFRTPLTSLRQFTDMLRETPVLDEQRRRLAYDVQSRATDRLTRLVESLLDFGRMEAGVRPYRFDPQDCASFVRDVVDEFRSEPIAVGHRIDFRVHGSGKAGIDNESLSRAIYNLLDNAVKYSPEPAPIELSLTRQDGHLMISVRDGGIGIPPHERQKIFEKFHRGEQARTLGIKGTGIGLAMVDEIVRAHHGRVDVASQPGSGSMFTIVLPVAD